MLDKESMRVGVLTRAEVAELNRVQRLGFGSIEWVAFTQSPVAPEHEDWKSAAAEIAAEARTRNLRISAIGAWYQNPLDPRQTDHARAVFTRAIEVAGQIGVKTVAGFPGAVIQTTLNERGGNPVYEPFENFLPQLLGFWEPLAQLAADHGVRIAFEHCPQGRYHLPIMGYNMLAQPAMWERLFNETRCANLGLEWDASHLLCQLIDPVANVHRFGRKIFHVHAKDAFLNRDLLNAYGICHPGVAEHRFPGLGQANWAEIVHALLRAGYDSDLNIEGWHDPVYRDHATEDPTNPLAGRALEDAGLRLAKRTLERYTQGTE
ncbi:MAG: sugar phosphate isomerase/epimerase [Verrucomicrobia bacterium]|nr:sugar phosphate isomerase/epimerase [Verrucomicrobiota bacterium]